jgi:hypothetical protein
MIFLWRHAPFRCPTNGHLQAKAPEKAIKLFKDRGLWDDALRLARHYRPDAVPDLERQRQAQALSGQALGASVDSKIQKAKLLERQVNGSALHLHFIAILQIALCMGTPLTPAMLGVASTVLPRRSMVLIRFTACCVEI